MKLYAMLGSRRVQRGGPSFLRRLVPGFSLAVAGLRQKTKNDYLIWTTAFKAQAALER